MKKTTTKSTKSPAPATKPVTAAKAVAPAKAAVKTGATVPPIPVTKTGRTVPPIPVTKTGRTVPPIPAVKPVAATRVVTTITALIDVGYGNALFIRGEGPGLSWEKGIPLDSTADDKWSIALGESSRPVVFKFLINDVTWSAGDDYSVAPGTSITLTPSF
jgi:hypothetical protein